jgi:hypothetical protein
LHYLDLEAFKEVQGMTGFPFYVGLENETAPKEPGSKDPFDSQDVRLVLAGELSPLAAPVRRDRLELAGVLDRGRQSRTEVSPAKTATHPAALLDRDPDRSPGR